MFLSHLRRPRSPIPHDLVIEDDLLPIGLEEYEQAVEACVKTLSRTPGVRAISQYGHLSIPGISDIDLFVVAEDQHFDRIFACTEHLRASLLHGRYLFPHQMAVCPLSLMPLRRILFLEHTVDALQVLWGEERVFMSDTPSQESQALLSALWDSAIWRIVFGLGSHTHSMRELLLLLNTFAVRTTINRAIIGGSLDRRLSHWCRGMRLRIQQCSGGRGEREIVSALHFVSSEWYKSQRALQHWWEERGMRGGSYYCYLLTALAPVFSPHLNISVPSEDHPTLSSGADALKDALEEYRAAVQCAKATACSLGRDPYHFFLRDGAGCFPSPFNLADCARRGANDSV